MKLLSEVSERVKPRFALSLLVAASFFPSTLALRAETPPDAATELRGLVSKVQSDLLAGKTNEAALREDLNAFDTVFARHKDEKSDAVAQILFMKAKLYSEVLEDFSKSIALIEQIKKDFPGTDLGQASDQVIDSLKKQEKAKALQQTLTMGSVFPDFNEKDLAGQPLSVGALRGKVVLIDFWATWCPPCRAELPNVINAYQQHHNQGFEVIGVSLDESREKLKDFIAAQKMTWPQYFDGQGWGNKLASKYGIQSIPATILLDGEGKIIGRNLRGEELEQAVAKALGKPAKS